MATIKEKLTTKEWTRENYRISTDNETIPVQRIAEIFDSDAFYWANAVPLDETKTLLQNSLNFALYDTSKMTEDPVDTSKSFIGFARCITDFVTFVYITDVWVDSDYQGKGLGSWLMQCVNEAIASMPYLRRSLLFTSDWQRSVPFYERLMGMDVQKFHPNEGLAMMTKLGRGHPNYQEAASEASNKTALK